MEVSLFWDRSVDPNGWKYIVKKRGAKTKSGRLDELPINASQSRLQAALCDVARDSGIEILPAEVVAEDMTTGGYAVYYKKD